MLPGNISSRFLKTLNTALTSLYAWQIFEFFGLADIIVIRNTPQASIATLKIL